jgi:hypothetical protein
MGNRIVRVTGVALAVSFAAAAPRAIQAPYVIYGPGTISCGKWTAEAQGPLNNRQFNLSWVLGYITGVGAALDKSMSLTKTDSAGMAAWIDQYCAKNPLSTLEKASEELATTLLVRKG